MSILAKNLKVGELYRFSNGSLCLLYSKHTIVYKFHCLRNSKIHTEIVENWGIIFGLFEVT